MNPSFDYDSLGSLCGKIQAATAEIHERLTLAASNFVAIGERLLWVKSNIGHGKFLPWLEAEFNWSERTAQKMMRAAERFSGVDLDGCHIAASALDFLASPSVSDDVRSEALSAARAGKPIVLGDVQQLAHGRASPTGTRAELPPTLSRDFGDRTTVYHLFLTKESGEAATIAIALPHGLSLGGCDELEALMNAGRVLVGCEWKIEVRRPAADRGDYAQSIIENRSWQNPKAKTRVSEFVASLETV